MLFVGLGVDFGIQYSIRFRTERFENDDLYAALTKAGVPASFIRIKGAGHGFEGAAPADLERAYAALMQWFEQHLRGAAK